MVPWAWNFHFRNHPSLNFYNSSTPSNARWRDGRTPTFSADVNNRLQSFGGRNGAKELHDY